MSELEYPSVRRSTLAAPPGWANSEYRDTRRHPSYPDSRVRIVESELSCRSQRTWPDRPAQPGPLRANTPTTADNYGVPGWATSSTVLLTKTTVNLICGCDPRNRAAYGTVGPTTLFFLERHEARDLVHPIDDDVSRVRRHPSVDRLTDPCVRS